MNRRPIIGITCNLMPGEDERSFSSGRDVFYSNFDYPLAVEEAGGLPVLIPLLIDRYLLDQMAGEINGLVVSGGDDVDPSTYGEELIDPRWKRDRQRVLFEMELIKKCLSQKKPILGICRGMQVLNVAFGGTLFQDLPSQRGGGIDHRMSAAFPAKRHLISIQKDTNLRNILGMDTLAVNSFHHQAIKTLGNGLKVSALAPDGVLEGLERRGDPLIMGVQWHPERMMGEGVQKKLLRAFVQQCGNS
ncbi:gamma-glutamyl-gamma-aminobutyrate hydrolase family protein [candidate division KSB1 bacterium]|nr:gamma-glutamyl-gamma-aminobutyrate hydrolase family protein [candidate division KSB1 bacterium]